MAYEPLHHKYRPQTFSDLVGQETIARTLSNALEQTRIAPAYLFTGPRGTGKTSSARILAKSLNCLASDRPTPHPCGKCEACTAISKGSALDVMEIDAASNTGVDNIREIIERSRFAPVQCRYKIYAIDECHMLSTAAFNALLKTLEEPPPQVVFILATTDPQRVLSTIISRCQRFDYRRIPLTDMTGHLSYIAERESIQIADDALTLVAQISNGGLRDAESLLDQLSLMPEQITVEKVWDLVGAVPEQDLLKLLRAINGNDSLAVLQQCRSLLDRGREPLVVLQNLATFYLNLLIAKTAPQNSELTAVTETCWQQLCEEGKNWQTASILSGQQHLKEAETQLKRTTQPRLWLEVTLLGLLPEAQSLVPNPHTVAPTSPQQAVTPLPTVVITPPAPPPTPTPQPDVPPTPATPLANPAAQIVELNSSVQLPTDTTDSAASLPIAQPASNTRSPVEPPAPIEIANESVTNQPNQDPIANQQIWSQVVSCLQPPTTQALLKQQCHLVNFDGTSAVVGVSSPNLEKMTQKKIPNIEAAFAQVCQHKVRVQIEVASAKKNANKASSIPMSQAIAQKPPLTPSSFPNLPTAAVPSQAVSENVAVAAPSTVLSTPAPTAPKPTGDLPYNPPQAIATQDNSRLTPVVTEPPIEKTVQSNSVTSESALDTDYANADLQQAIEALTQSFEGEVVQLDSDLNDLDDDFESEEPENISSISESIPETVTVADRPNVDEYDDEW
ncbi:MAG: DNA polymerase III subunit gamma/tau [Cyanobacteria bacterium J06623_7]